MKFLYQLSKMVQPATAVFSLFVGPFLPAGQHKGGLLLMRQNCRLGVFCLAV